jgi:hypothetical protein
MMVAVVVLLLVLIMAMVVVTVPGRLIRKAIIENYMRHHHQGTEQTMPRNSAT